LTREEKEAAFPSQRTGASLWPQLPKKKKKAQRYTPTRFRQRARQEEGKKESMSTIQIPEKRGTTPPSSSQAKKKKEKPLLAVR